MSDSKETRLIRIHEVVRLTGLSVSAIYSAMARDEFPRPVKIGRQAVAWRSRDVRDWINSRPPARDDTPQPAAGARA